MVSDLRELLRDNVTSPPPDRLDVGTVVGAGRRRVRRRRTLVGAAALSTAVVLTFAVVARPGGLDGAGPASGGLPKPDAPTISLADADRAVPGRDYEVLASHINRDLNLNHDSGQYFDGVTDDGLILFRDGPIRFADDPSTDGRPPRFALMDPATGKKAWLPALQELDARALPIELGRNRLVFIADDEQDKRQSAYVFDRTARTWSAMSWLGQPSRAIDGMPAPVVGPDGRLYVLTPAAHGGEPPTPRGGPGVTHHVWSLSLTNDNDVRDEKMDVGAIAFTDASMVWTDAYMGNPGRVHVRDLATGKERSFDPHSGKDCDLLTLAVGGERVAMGESCGDDSVSDQRLQILSTAGDQVVTIQDESLNPSDWSLDAGSDLVEVHVGGSDHTGDRDRGGTYVYDLAADRLIRFGDDVGRRSYADGPVSGDQFVWTTPLGDNYDGMTQRLVRLLR